MIIILEFSSDLIITQRCEIGVDAAKLVARKYLLQQCDVASDCSGFLGRNPPVEFRTKEAELVLFIRQRNPALRQRRLLAHNDQPGTANGLGRFLRRYRAQQLVSDEHRCFAKQFRQV